MSVPFQPLGIIGAFVVRPRVFSDDRGFFYESWRSSLYAFSGDAPFVQDNLSLSSAGVLRGLHYQVGAPQGQLVTIVRGQVRDVIVDLRRGSPTFRQWEALALDAANPTQIFMPSGVAHGFHVLSGDAILHYKCTREYDPDTERGIRWNDPEIGIVWNAPDPRLSRRDAGFPYLADVGVDELPSYIPPR